MLLTWLLGFVVRNFVIFTLGLVGSNLKYYTVGFLLQISEMIFIVPVEKKLVYWKRWFTLSEILFNTIDTFQPKPISSSQRSNTNRLISQLTSIRCRGNRLSRWGKKPIPVCSTKHDHLFIFVLYSWGKWAIVLRCAIIRSFDVNNLEVRKSCAGFWKEF